MSASGGDGILPPPAPTNNKNNNTSSAASAEASRLMPPPSSTQAAAASSSTSAQRSGAGGSGGGGRARAAGRGRSGRGGRGRRGPGRPPNSERQGPSSTSSSSSAGRASEVRRGPGRPPGKRKKMAGSSGNDPKAKRKYTKRKPTVAVATADSLDSSDKEDEYTEASSMDYIVESTPATPRSTGYETDPETALDVVDGKVSTIHWDPTEVSKVGWKARLLMGANVQDGRIVQYDPYSHKHKIQLDIGLDEDPFEEIKQKKKRKNNKSNSIWLRLHHSDAQMATRLVWAHVKGYAWWPAMKMELTSPITSSMASPRDGYVFVHFIGAPEVATLRNSPDCIRTFSQLVKDPVIEKSKKKRNAKAIAQAQLEELQLQHYQNQAARHLARKAIAMADQTHATGSSAARYIGKRIKLFSSDINYPGGATIVGVVRQYSSFQKKWLISFELPHKLKHKMSGAWINLLSKDCSLTLLQNDSDKPRRKTDEIDPTDIDFVPFLFGFKFQVKKKPEAPVPKKKGKTKEEVVAATVKAPQEKDEVELQLIADARLDEVLKERCRGCVDIWSGDHTVTCADCKGFYHLGCVDPPISIEAFQRMNKGGVEGWKCPKCTLCLGCYQKDVAFGCHPVHPMPPTISFPPGETLNLCSMCVKAYDADKYCPNCAHSWDDIKYQKVLEQLEAEGVGPPEVIKQRRLGESDGPASDLLDSPPSIAKGMPPNTPFANGTLMNGARVDPAWYHAENNLWGYTEGDMLVCDSCDLWIHAGCGGLSQEEYEETSEGNHSIYSKEFLCRVCCRKRCVELIERLQREDIMMLFAVPVTEKVAPNYSDVIKQPMDLQTMLVKAQKLEYLNYGWVRDDFALMVLNALSFNRFYTKFWYEAKRFYEECLKVVFSSKMLGKAAPPSKYDELVQKNFVAADAAQQMEVDRLQQDETTEKKDLVAGVEVAKVSLAPLREKAPDESSCLPFQSVKIKPVDSYYCAWMDCCFTCGSSGAADTMIFCVDCGEAFHSFCANVPIHSMDAYSVAGWRCPNCKVCEISGDVPTDELRMLFCEMCDRAFSLDLLDPPLRKAPSGLWICGQCVDCKMCKNTSEPPRPGAEANPATSSISLKYWSRDPEKCYRCGGCDGMPTDMIVGQKLDCNVCKKILRRNDGNFVKCSDCNAYVHLGCDRRADDYMKQLRTEELLGARALKNQKTKAKYKCPTCSGVPVVTKLDYTTMDTSNTADMHAQAWQTIVQGGLQGDNYSPRELHGKLLDQLDWQTREMWRDEYVDVVNEGIRYFGMAKAKFGDPRKMVQGIAGGKLDLPVWLGQRACRFLVLAKRLKWDAEGFSPKGIESCVFAAKGAAAFLAVACHAMNRDMEKTLVTYARVECLLKEPLDQGVFEIPMDTARLRKRHSKKDSIDAIARDSQIGSSVASADSNRLASPLCGWGQHVDPSSLEHTWRDPRKCCLCHLCGDDDAGFPETEDEPSDQLAVSTSDAKSDSSVEAAETPLSRFTRLGRLLPMWEGQWVHASCAQWSSEVWESPRGGLINAMEKARSRGAKLKCFGCGRAGATVGCNKQNCSFNYHFPCAKACGAVFTSKQQMFCANHKVHAHSAGTIVRESVEAMKTLIVAPEKQKIVPGADKDTPGESKDHCLRVGSLIVHSLGKIVHDADGFHVEDYIYPEGYVATRIFWSMTTPRTRTVYILKIERNNNSDGTTGPLFTITPGDAPSSKIRGRFASQVYKTLVDRVRKANAAYFTQGELFSKLPMIRRTRKKYFALNGPQFFGFGLDHVRERLEALSGIEAVVSPLKPSSPKYRFCFVQPNLEAIVDLQRKRAAVAAERALENSTGCARTEGSMAVSRSGGSGRITRALVRSVGDAEEVGGANINSNNSRKKNTDPEMNKMDKKRHQAKYNKMKAVPMEDRLVARRSHIHGWGLFTKLEVKKDDMITEYMGECVRQCIADKREAAYEISGEGSCYMFRLDPARIIDATVIGCMARFMNHCCQPNAYAKIITVDTDIGVDKKIAVLANRDIAAGDEITYDYKFPVEDGSLRCTCGAPNCIGRMN